MENQNQEVVIDAENPWLQVNGQHTPDEYLKRLTPSWDAETWERYLGWFETPRAESLEMPWKYDRICEEATESIFVNAQASASDELKNCVSAYLAGLTAQQRQVIDLIFWHGRSERHVARELGINQKSVHRLKLRALKKIGGLIKGGLTSRIVRGEIHPLPTMGDASGKKVLELAVGTFPKAG